MSSGNFAFLGKQVHYEVDGDGQPVVLLNGIMMSTRSWQPFVGAFGRHVKLVRVDFLDQGQTEKAPDIPYTQGTQADLVVALLDHLGLERVHVVGISYGGEVAVRLAIEHPERLCRLVLFNTTAFTSTWLRHIGHSWMAAGRTRDGEAYYKTTIPVIYSQRFYGEQVDWMTKRQRILEPLFSNPVFLDAIERLTVSAENYDERERLHLVKSPTLIVAAEEDTLTPRSDQETLHRLIAGSQLVVIPGCGHASMYEKPVVFVSLVLGFLLLDVDVFTI